MLRDAVKLYAPGKRMLKELYGDLALKYDTSAQAVERCMRFAIKDAALHGDGGCWNELFGHSIYAPTEAPSISAFVSRMAQYFSVED